MNIENVNKAIAIMARAKEKGKLSMISYQTFFRRGGYAKTETELHTCGNTACFAGYVAVSPEFQESGGLCGKIGEPVLGDYSADFAIAQWLGISDVLAEALTFNVIAGPEDHHVFYAKPWEAVEFDDVIRVLTELRDNGEQTMLKKLKDSCPNLVL